MQFTSCVYVYKYARNNNYNSTSSEVSRVSPFGIIIEGFIFFFYLERCDEVKKKIFSSLLV